MSEGVHVHEVAPRDGLQNEPVTLRTETKAELIARLAAARPDSIEITSFVRPDRIPPLADAGELAARLRGAPFRGEVALAALVPNLRGYERFRAAGLEAMTVLVSCTESHNRANLNRGVADSLIELAPLIEAARRDGVFVRAYASMAFGCPFEGSVAPERVLELVCAFAAMGADLVLLADTLGTGEPAAVERLFERALAELPEPRIGFHGHDTYGRAAENVRAAWRAGARWFDASAGGCGGCPYAPGAAGNLATERLLLTLDELGAAHGMRAAALHAASRFLEDALGRKLPGRSLADRADG